MGGRNEGPYQHAIEAARACRSDAARRGAQLRGNVGVGRHCLAIEKQHQQLATALVEPAERRSDDVPLLHLEQCFIALLPEEKRKGHTELTIPPRATGKTEIAIEAHDLTRRFGDFIAVNRVTLSIERGEIFGFLGSNGCGKSTTMKMLTGLLPPSEGTATLFGHSVEALKQSPWREPMVRHHTPWRPAMSKFTGNGKAQNFTGDPETPLSDETLSAKFRANSEVAIGEATARRIEESVHAGGGVALSEFLDLVLTPG